MHLAFIMKIIGILKVFLLFQLRVLTSLSPGNDAMITHVDAKDGETVNLKCKQQTGGTFWQGPANFTTYTSGSTINPSLKSYKRLAVEMNEKYFNLTIKDVSKEDEGLYKCSTGVVDTFFELRIQHKINDVRQSTARVTDGVVSVSNIKHQDMLIVNIEALPSSTISEGDSLTLICRYGSIPEPTRVTWKFGDSLLLGGGHLYEYNSIHFPSIQRRQSGNYSCEIDTVFGKANNTIYISINEKEPRTETVSYPIGLLVLIITGIVLGILLSFLVLWYIIKGLKKRLSCKMNKDRVLPQQRNSSELNSESHYDEIESVLYCPVQIHGSHENAVSIGPNQLVISIEKQTKDFSITDRQNCNSGRTLSAEGNDISSGRSDPFSNSTYSEKSDDSYLVPCTSVTIRLSGEPCLFGLPTTSACSNDESPVSSSNSETDLKSDQRYENLKSVNITEHPYLTCH